ncbi:lachesin-like [Pseudomyrmex gracilis]|uniref:lachesin-like n=1 Tax=Pseudomyrmex gracilis TaxID=219809 RepID=UPI00099518AB|nr:lachesin-like [Pseudomyrmex gracilis]
MLPPRILGLLVILLAVQGLCKPSKNSDIEENEYEDDTPINDEDDDDDDDDSERDTNEPPPEILSWSQSIRDTTGSTVILPCNVKHTDNYAVAWLKDDKYLYFESQPHVTDPKRIVRMPNNSLVIYNATVSDSSDSYRCSIIIRKNYTIDLIHRVLIDPMDKGIRVTPSRRINVVEGTSTRFGCETNIQPPPEIKWFIETKKVSNYDPDLKLEGNFITITKVHRYHSGLYQCLAEDGSKNPLSEAIRVVVYYAPEVEVKRKIVHSGIGVESELACIVSAYPEAIMKWYRNDKELTHKKNEIVMHHGETNNHKIKHVLKITHNKLRDFGEYKCRAENHYGQSEKIVNLSGMPSQAKMSGAEVTDDDRGIILKWTVESYSPIVEFKLQYRRKDDEQWITVNPDVKDQKKKGNQYTVKHLIKELQPGSYEAILTARNEFGWSPLSEPHMFTGDYPPEMARKENAAATLRPTFGTLLTLILVVLSCAFTSV